MMNLFIREPLVLAEMGGVALVMLPGLEGLIRRIYLTITLADEASQSVEKSGNS